MSDAVDRIVQWAQAAQDYNAVPWDRMPEIDLYMDQIISYTNKQLQLFQRNENSKLLTSSMINNYVKDGLVPRPDHKKYSPDHIARLMMICLLKQVLSIPDIALLIKSLWEESQSEALYNTFCTAQKTALSEACGRVTQTAPEGERELRHLALALAIESNARRIVAERILSELENAPK